MAKQNIIGALREQSDWEQNDEHRLGFIKNKPFYDTRKAESLTITFPTPYTETVTDPDSGTIIYKISEQVPTYEDVLRGWIVMDGQKEYFSEPGLVQTSIMADGTKGLLIGGTFAIVSDQSNILTPGIWVRDIEQLNGATLHFPSVTTGELKTIDPKFLPNGMGGGMPLIISAEPQGPVNIVGEAKNMTYSDVVKAFNEGTLYGAFCNWMGYSLVPCSIEIDFATDAERPCIYIELTERTSGPAIGLYWTPDGTISNEYPYPAQE